MRLLHGVVVARFEAADEGVLLALLRVDGFAEPVVVDAACVVEASFDVFAVERVEAFLNAFIVQEFKEGSGVWGRLEIFNLQGNI